MWSPNRALPFAALTLLLGGFALAFYWAPEDADQGFSQKIFYVHVPIALTAYACFAVGAWKAFRLLWKRDPRADLESYVAVHQGVIFGVLVLIPVSFLAVRIAGTILHPTIFTHEGADLPWQMLVAFVVCLGGMLSLAATLYRVELTSKRIDASLRELRELLA